MKKTRFYKKAKLIAVYDECDNLVAVCDNVKDFAEMFEMEKANADSVICKIARGDHSYFMQNGKKMFIYFIDLEPNEVREFSMIF